MCNQPTLPEPVAKPWQQRQSKPQPINVVVLLKMWDYTNQSLPHFEQRSDDALWNGECDHGDMQTQTLILFKLLCLL
jgi:hypothetical protein